jgi:hypothetical protein
LQERASLVQGQVPSFLAGQLPESPDSSKNKKELMQQVQEFIAGWQQVSTGANWGSWSDTTPPLLSTLPSRVLLVTTSRMAYQTIR